MRPLEPIRVSLSVGTEWCGCCTTNKVTIFRGNKKITFDVCSDFADWFQQKYTRRPRLARVWHDLESVSWMDYAMFNIGGEVRAIFEVLIAAERRKRPLAAEHVHRCLPPDLVEALVAETLDAM